MAESSTAKPASRIMLAVFGSRILGLVREVVMNSIFGAGREMDAFLAAFRIPNLLRDLFAEGALSTAFVSTFSKKLATEGRASAFRLANLVNSTATTVMAAVVLLGIVGAEGIVGLIGWGVRSDPAKLALTVDLTRIMFPFIMLVSLAAVWMGLLNSLGSFGLPASASTAFNLVSIVAGLALGWWFDPELGPRAIYGFAMGTVLGGGAQWLIQVPKARALGYRVQWAWDLGDPGLREVLRLMAPAVVGGAAVQVNVLVNTSFALTLEEGSVTCLNNAFRLMQLPIGLFGVAIATVTLPSVARSAALADPEAVRAKLREGLRLATFLTLPAATGLVLLALPVVRLIFERGAFTEEDSRATAWALQAYAVGLSAYAAIKVLSPAFYALGLPKVPLRVSLIGIGLNLVLNTVFIFIFGWGPAGLALSTSLVALINFMQLLLALRRPLGGLSAPGFGRALAKIALASGVMAAGVGGLLGVLQAVFPAALEGGFLQRLGGVVVLVGGGAGIYFGAATALRLEETAVLRRLAQRLRG
jgi:putative peptidoglycan lipid II flippase